MISQTAITGVIVAREGTSPGPASAMLYTIDANIPGSGVVRLTGQRPMDAYPDEVDVIGRAVGRGVHGIIVGAWPGGQVQWDFTELLAFGLCPGVTPPAGLGMMIDPVTGLPVPVIPPPGGGPLSGTGTPSDAPGPGGEQ